MAQRRHAVTARKQQSTTSLSKAVPEVPTRPGELSVDVIKSQVAKIQRLMVEGMIGPTKENPSGVHFGIIPGTSKPTLLKPGAEKLCFMFQLRVIIKEEDITITDYDGGHREYRALCHIFDKSGEEVATGLGTCSTLEGKYRYRWDNTGQPVPREYWNSRDRSLIGGDSFTPRKAWVDDASSGRSQQWLIFQRVEHDNPADYYNTALKIAKKRGHVDGTITATACSELFTQDTEDMEANAKAGGYKAPFDDAGATQQQTTEGGQTAGSQSNKPANGGKTYPLTEKHNELKGMIDGYIKSDLNPNEISHDEAFKEIIKNLTTWPGHEVGCTQLDQISPNMAKVAVDKFNQKLAAARAKAGKK